MIDHKHSFAKFFRELLKNIDSDINFYPEPSFQQVIYPAVVFHWGANRKTKTLSMWMHELQIDVLFNEWKRSETDLITTQIFEALNIDADIPGTSRRTPKSQWIDDKGNILSPPNALLPDTDIQWRFLPESEINQIEEPDKPELMRNSFTLHLYYRNR